MGLYAQPFFSQREVLKILVKCRICSKKIERTTAYKLVVDSKNNYYCSEQEYKEWRHKIEIRDNAYNLIYDIFGYKVTNTVLYKEVDELGGIYGFSKISAYLQEKYGYICKALSKDFNSEYTKIRYFTAILKNSLADFQYEEKMIIKTPAIDFVKTQFKRKDKRTPLVEYEDECGGDGNG